MILLCPGCGHHAQVKLKKGAKIRCSVCGAITAKRITRPKIWTKWPEVRPPPRARIDTHAGLIWFREAKGFRPGWSSWRFRAIYGGWPPRTEPEPMVPYQELTAWLATENNRRKAERRKQESRNVPVQLNGGFNCTHGLFLPDVDTTSTLMTEED